MIGDHLGKWVIFKEIGRGGMGVVYRARQIEPNRLVALKMVLHGPFADARDLRRFRQEAEVIAGLDHPNIVPVHDLAADAAGTRASYTMQFVTGRTLTEMIATQATQRDLERILQCLISVCDALAFAHSRGIVHRDLKPDNIMVGEFGQVYLMDWGLAKLSKTQPASGGDALMNAPGPVGTPDYMAPEQARGNPDMVDERADVFGLGALLFEVLSGQPPYGMDGDQNAILKRATSGRVLDIDTACGPIGVSRRIRAVAEKATCPDPDGRYASVRELQDAMRAFLHGGLHLPRKSFAPGELIVREGDRGDAAYMIVAGKCRAFRTVDGREETLSVMEPGEAFGEMALILFEPRAASVVAVDQVTVLVLDQATMNEGLGLSGWTGALVRALAQRFADLEQMVRSSGIRRG